MQSEEEFALSFAAFGVRNGSGVDLVVRATHIIGKFGSLIVDGWRL